MSLIISLLYLLLNIAVVVLCAALIWWFLRWFGIPLDPLVLKICQAIVALVVLILIVSWFAGVLPPRGIFGRAGEGRGLSMQQTAAHSACLVPMLSHPIG